MPVTLTNPKVFAQVYLCTACKRSIADHDDEHLTPACLAASIVERNDRRWIREELFDVVIERVGQGSSIFDTEVTVNVERQFVVHSPTGLEYGYGGFGPADLALNILGAFLPPFEAWRLHQDFKWRFIASLDRDRPLHVIPGATIHAWVTEQWARSAA